MSIRGSIFLSHAATDKPQVDAVRQHLDNASVFYDLASIAPGEDTLAAMKRGVADAAVFVLFHSPETETVWVKLEQDLAEIEKIRNRTLQILVCPVNGATHKTLPAWMQRFMTAPAGFTPHDTARTIIALHRKALGLAYPESVQEMPGREVLLRKIQLDILSAPANQGVPISTLVVVGVQGMGRTTLVQQLMSTAFSGTRQGGPIFDLPTAAGAIDWHLRFFEELNGPLDQQQIADQNATFGGLNPREQAQFLAASLEHWEGLDQVVTVKTRWGLRDRGNELLPWLDELLRIIAKRPRAKLILISERRLPEVKLHAYPHVRQYIVEELPRETIEYILSQRIDAHYLDTNRLPSVAARVHGHPATANFAARLVNGGRSLESLSVAPDAIFAFQASVLNALFEGDVLSDLQKRILKLLSWFPRLPISALQRVFVDVDASIMLEAIWMLNEYSLVDQTEFGYYKVPEVVGSSYRRLTTEHDHEIYRRVALGLLESFKNNNIEVELIEATLVGVVAIQGRIPDEFLNVITASTLLEVVEKEYRSGLDAVGQAANNHFKTASSLAKMADGRDSSDDTFENILFYGADAAIRAGENPNEFLTIIKRRGFASGDYLEGSYLYHVVRDYEGAARALRRTLSSPNFRIRNVRLLVRIYLSIGKPNDALDALEKIHEARLMRDTGLVVMKVRALRGARRNAEARALLDSLGNSENEYGDLALYRAAQSLRAGAFPEARGFLDTAREAPRSNKLAVKLLQCACEVEQGQNVTLAETCALARAAYREADAFQLEARASLVAGDWRTAEDILARISSKDAFDLSLELRMLEMKAGDPSVARDPVLSVQTKAKRDEVVRGLTLNSEGQRLHG